LFMGASIDEFLIFCKELLSGQELLS
jgi:hypothetical protein